MLVAFKLVTLFLIETFLLAVILATFAEITPDSAGKAILIIGLCAVGMVGVFYLFVGLSKKR